MGLLPDDPSEYRAYVQRDEVWRPAIDVIAQRHGLGSSWARPLLGTNVVFLGDATVIKMFCPTWGHEAQIEHDALAACRGQLPVAIPDVVARGDLEGWPYLVLTRLPGRELATAWPDLDDSVRTRLVAQTAELLACLHQVPPPPDLPDAWDQFDLSAEAVLDKHRRQEARPVWVDEIEAFLRDEPCITGPRVLLHCDVHPEHLMFGDDGCLCGLFDFADCMRGPAVFDVAATACLMAIHIPGGADVLYRAYGPLERAWMRPALLRQRYCALEEAVAAVPADRRPETIADLLALMGSSTAAPAGA